jgi:hypothetical protein
VVEWYQVSKLGSSDLLTFEAILHENGDIVIQYQSMNGTLNSATVGIEDSDGVDGLEYWGSVANGKAVRFRRPPPSARVKVVPAEQERFVSIGETVAFDLVIRNTGELGSDTYDLVVSSTWPSALYASDGTTLLVDTGGSPDVDTGTVAQGSSTTVVLKVAVPATATAGDNESIPLLATSVLDPAQEGATSAQVAIPAPFAQVFQDNADGILRLSLNHPQGQGMREVSPERHYGYDGAIAETADGFVYAWSIYHHVGSLNHNEIEYALLDRAGNVVRDIDRLTDHTSASLYTRDYDPVVTTSPDGHIGIAWYRYLYNDATGEWNYNIYYAVLDAAGDVVIPPTNLTNNLYWGTG